MDKKVATIAVGISMCSLFTIPASAGTVTAQTLLPQSGAVATQDNPPCGDSKIEGLTSDILLQGISGVIDAYAGVPITSDILATQPPGNIQWVEDRLGLNVVGGNATCQALCVAFPITGQSIHGEKY